MYKILMLVTLAIGLTTCGRDSGNHSEATSPEKNRVEVIYFHTKKRCATCRAIEENTREVVDSAFAKELEEGSVVFKTVDISSREGEELADRYKVTWSSLFVNKWENGRETRADMTEFAFGNARKDPAGFKKVVADKIHEYRK